MRKYKIMSIKKTIKIGSADIFALINFCGDNGIKYVWERSSDIFSFDNFVDFRKVEIFLRNKAKVKELIRGIFEVIG